MDFLGLDLQIVLFGLGVGILIGLAMKTIANFANHFMQTPLDPQFAAQRWEN